MTLHRNRLDVELDRRVDLCERNAVHDLGTSGGLRWKSSDSVIDSNLIFHAGNASARGSGR